MIFKVIYNTFPGLDRVVGFWYWTEIKHVPFIHRIVA